MKIITVNVQDKVQRFQIAGQILRLYEQAEISTRRSIELFEKLYVTGSIEQKWNWPNVYAIVDEEIK